jgi:hypothetical protein
MNERLFSDSKKYRWLGLSGILIILANYWIGSFVGSLYLDVVARLLFVIFSLAYWKQHKDLFSVTLLFAAIIILVLGVTTFLQIFITPGLI